MIELLRRVAAVDPARPAVVTYDATVSYGDLLAMAESVAADFVARGIERAALVEIDAVPVLAALAGASAAGTQLCLYPPEPEQVADLRDRFDHDWCFGSVDLLPVGERLALTSISDIPPAVIPDERPHMVLTTGTTGAPRGVQHDWGRLLVGIDRVSDGASERWLLAYGLHQFAGLQIILHVFAAGATLIAPTPRRPVEGLAAMRSLDVTHASATPTYWRFVLARLRSDGGERPRLRQITMGGEAAPPSLLADIEATFPEARVSHVYAASEFGSSGSVRDGRSGLPASVLDRGDDATVAMKVVDGELWVRSRTGMLGYYGEDPVDADGWRPTGDLVEVVGDRLEFRGRASEVINVGGVKVHPLPIEECVARVDGVEIARVYGRPSPVAGAIVAVDIVLAADAVEADVRKAVRSATSDLPSAARPRSITVVDTIETTGNKVIRRMET